MPPPVFARSVNPISTRGGTLCPPNYYVPPRIFRPCNFPVKISFSEVFSSNLSFKVSFRLILSSLSPPRFHKTYNCNRKYILFLGIYLFLKVSKSRKQILKLSFEPKNEQKYFCISALDYEKRSNQKNKDTLYY